MAGQRRGHTLQATALVHEAFVRSVRGRAEWRNRDHFLATAATAMRTILVDHARRRTSAKRGGKSRRRVPLDAVLDEFEEKSGGVIALDEVLTSLGCADARAARVVEMLFFGGMTKVQVARRLGVSRKTVERDWNVARAWLATRMAS